MLPFTAVVCALFLQVAPAPSPTPDFSGRWTLVEPAQPGPKIATQLAVTTATEQTKDGPALAVTVKRTVGRDVQSDTYKVGLVGGIMKPNGTASRIAAGWDGSTLVLENGTYPMTVSRQGKSTEHDERWSIDADGRLVMDVTDRQPDGEPKTTRLVYRRTK